MNKLSITDKIILPIVISIAVWFLIWFTTKTHFNQKIELVGGYNSISEGVKITSPRYDSLMKWYEDDEMCLYKIRSRIHKFNFNDDYVLESVVVVHKNEIEGIVCLEREKLERGLKELIENKRKICK